MQKIYLFGLGMIALTLLPGCGSQGQSKGDAKPAKTESSKEETHGHGSGPHGGTVIDWGGKYHVEFCMDHGKKQATVHILGIDARKPAPIKADKLLLSIKQPLFQIELKAMPQEGEPPGLSSRFVGTHDNFGVEQEFAGTISGQVDGKNYGEDFQEEPAKK